MKTITYEDFVSFNPCWLTDREIMIKHAAQLARYRAMRDKWSAIDILQLDEVEAEDRLWLVLREELIDAPILHEFGCRCAERALARINKPDARSVAAIEAKRRWLRGEVPDEALLAARNVAWRAERYAAKEADLFEELFGAWLAARAALWVVGGGSAGSSARDVARYAAWAAEGTMERATELEWQIAELMRMLEAQE